VCSPVDDRCNWSVYSGNDDLSRSLTGVNVNPPVNDCLSWSLTRVHIPVNDQTEASLVSSWITWRAGNGPPCKFGLLVAHAMLHCLCECKLQFHFAIGQSKIASGWFYIIPGQVHFASGGFTLPPGEFTLPLGNGKFPRNAGLQSIHNMQLNPLCSVPEKMVYETSVQL
jgi:hypothetical protein